MNSVADRNRRELEKARPSQDEGDEADSIRRWSSGDDFHGGPNAKATIEGGFILAILALVFSIVAIALVWYTSNSNMETIRELTAEAARASEEAEQATTQARIAGLYATQVYTELNRLGYPVKSPAEFDHELQPENDPAFKEDE